MASPAAFAQGWALSRFDPAPAGDRMFGVPSPYAAGDLTPHVMVLADYAHNPLVLRRETDDEVVGAVVGDQLVLHLDASLALWRRVTVDVDLPLAVLQAGDDPNAGGVGAQSPSGAALGDLRLGARVSLLGQYHDPFQLALGGFVWLPTGSQASFLSDGVPRAMPQVIVGGRIDPLVWSFAAGPHLRATRTAPGGEQGPMLQWGGGVGFLLAEGRLQVGPEVNMALGLADPSARTLNGELLLDARYRVLPDIEAGLGLGPGLTGAAGTPDFRGVAMVAWTAEQRLPRDGDGDGIGDALDACHDRPGVQSEEAGKNGCPAPKDRDGDGIADPQDACPDVPGIQSADAARNGCPSDKDGDGIADAKDACPELPGPPDPNPRMNGCPRDDRDQDGIPDAIDMCPREKGLPSENLDENGCPKTLRVTSEEVRLLQQIQFDFDSARIKPISNPILDEIAQALKDHPEILHVEVQGHTDESGTKAYNRALSQRRAEAVRQALISRGIDRDRLSAKGYGRDVPLTDNETDEGRQKNRRVQFKIVQTTTGKP